MSQLLYKINTKRLVKRAVFLDEKNIVFLEKRIKKAVETKGRCVVAVGGGAGSGKSTLARFIKKQGFLSIPKNELFIVDDLRGPEGERYKRKDLGAIVDSINKKVFLLFDFRAALYLKRADICILFMLEEAERVENLKKRSLGRYNKYKKRYYSVPPTPFSLKTEDTYIVSENIFTILDIADETMH